jgi:hypothetical protein
MTELIGRELRSVLNVLKGPMFEKEYSIHVRRFAGLRNGGGRSQSFVSQ